MHRRERNWNNAMYSRLLQRPIQQQLQECHNQKQNILHWTTIKLLTNHVIEMYSQKIKLNSEMSKLCTAN